MQFYSHPIIDAIVKNPYSDRRQLYRNSGLDARTFLRELKMLLNNHHLEKEGDRYLPRKHTLAVYKKDGRRQIDEIELRYISAKYLHYELFPVENWNDYDVWDDFEVQMFFGTNKVDEEQLPFFQTLTCVKLDLSKYDYYFGAEHAYLAEDKLTRERTYEDFTIIHLDDHPLFSSSVEKGMKKLFPGINWLYFTYVEDAIKCVEERRKEEESINLIITDFIHVGLDGYEFAKVVRHLDEDYRFHTPILMYTLVVEEDERIQKGLKEKMFTQYLPKHVHGKELKNIVLDLLQPIYKPLATIPMIWN